MTNYHNNWKKYVQPVKTHVTRSQHGMSFIDSINLAANNKTHTA